MIQGFEVRVRTAAVYSQIWDILLASPEEDRSSLNCELETAGGDWGGRRKVRAVCGLL